MKRPPHLPLNQYPSEDRASTPSPATSYSSTSNSDRESPSASDTTNEDERDNSQNDDFDLDKLRQNVQKNLQLRPLMSAPIPLKLDASDSPPLSTTSTIFYTPVDVEFDEKVNFNYLKCQQELIML